MLAHFPVRSPRQIARKALGSWPAHVARPDRGPEQAFQWKRAFDAVVAGGRLTPQRLQALAFDYPRRQRDGHARGRLVFDPVPLQFELRYHPKPQPTPLEILADTAVRLAEELSNALRDGAAGDLDPRHILADGDPEGGSSPPGASSEATAERSRDRHRIDEQDGPEWSPD